MIKKLWSLLTQTWIWLRHGDFTQEPPLQRVPRQWLVHQVRNLEYNPHTQWKYHLRMSWFWIFNFPLVAILYFCFHDLWIPVGLLVNTFYSLYANFDTEFGGVHAAWAAMGADEILAHRVDTNRAVAEQADQNLSDRLDRVEDDHEEDDGQHHR